MYLEDCSDHMNVEFGVALALLIMVCGIGLCWWWTRAALQVDYGCENRWRRETSYYGACGQYPGPAEAHRIAVSAPSPQAVYNTNPTRYSRVASGQQRV